MKPLVILPLLAIASPLLAQDPPPLPKPSKEHEWLRKLAGEWTSEGEVVAGPGQPPVKTQGSETARSVGGFWLHSEQKGEVMGMPFTGLLTLGYDEKKKKYVGTWVDSFGAHLWTYEGTLEGDTLTLFSEGPRMDDPSKPGKYREVVEIKSPDHKVFTSAIEQDGKWDVFVTIQYRRKK